MNWIPAGLCNGDGVPASSSVAGATAIVPAQSAYPGWNFLDNGADHGHNPAAVRADPNRPRTASAIADP
jgi:hypothetical protein